MKKSKDLLQIQVGAFVAIGLLLTMMVIFLLGSEKQFFESHYTLVAYFDNISGLRKGATVQLAGIHAGSVKDILFEKDLGKKNYPREFPFGTRSEQIGPHRSGGSVDVRKFVIDDLHWESVASLAASRMHGNPSPLRGNVSFGVQA